jgi:hypothetical protein
MKFDIVYNLILMAQLPALDASQIMQAVMLGLGVVVIATSVGIVLFEWADI